MSERSYTECPDCHATPYNRDERVITGRVDGEPTTTYHTKDCPHYGGPGKAPRLRLVRPDEEPTT